VRIITLIIACWLVFSCKEEPKQIITVEKPMDYLLTFLTPEETNIHFKNTIVETYEESYLQYQYIYNGSGVAVGDLNNDGLLDIYFGGNSSDDKLYINEGNFKFKDISSNLGKENLKGWSTGINFIDINSDGLLDIYVCRSGPSKIKYNRKNKLFINQGNMQFKESSELYNLDKDSYSVQSAFFDYDLDGDLDLYLANHPNPSWTGENFEQFKLEEKKGNRQTDFFFENIDGNFIDKTKESGLRNFGYRHGIAVGDLNNDYYPDLYVSSDFDHSDLLYINNGNKSFTNSANNQLNHMSYSSMGNDMADINNDGLSDIFVVDMASSNHYSSKVNMKSMNTPKFNSLVENGYHYQYMLNTLHINKDNNMFSEIAQLSGIGKTDWSWAPLFFDIDLDGKKDLYITNGVKKNWTYRDLQADYDSKMKTLERGLEIHEILELVPNDINLNNTYQNIGEFKFKDVSKSWVTPIASNSNGAAYADLDNDGDLDLVINNMEEKAGIYKNTSNNKNYNYIKLKLEGSIKNPFAIGAKVEIKTGDEIQVQELHNARGYLSSVSHLLTFGCGTKNEISKIKVIWDNKKVTELKNIKPNQTLVLNYKDANPINENFNTLVKKPKQLLTEINSDKLNINYKHKENKFNDYSKQLLLPQKQSTQGPCLSVGDVNGDTLEDFFVGGANGQGGQLFIQKTNHTFKKGNNSAFIKDKNHEDVGSLFFDSDNDGDLDLYITSSGYELNEDDNLLQDRLYTNDGKGNFKKSNNLPVMLSSTKAVKSFDYDQDGDLDLIVGGRVIPGKYPLAPQSFILENNQGIFTNVTQVIAPGFERIGMISDIEITDYNNDNSIDIMLVGQWMPITIFSFENGKFVKTLFPEFDKTEGWYNSIISSDFNKDGNMDYVLGNLGKNNKFHPTLGKPLHIFSNNFDDNTSYDIALSKEFRGELVPVRGKDCSSEQTPFLNEKISSFKEFASLNIEGIYGNDAIASSNHMIAYNFKSLYLQNNGNGSFNVMALPNMAQFSPTQDFEVQDLNNDGFMDLIGVGNLYDAEVETVRYDASYGYILLNDGKGNFLPSNNNGFFCDKDMRMVSKINIDNKPHFIVASNNDVLSIFKLN